MVRLAIDPRLFATEPRLRIYGFAAASLDRASAHLSARRPDERWITPVPLMSLALATAARHVVSIGGHDVTALPLARLRALVGYAPQDAFLFSATVAENIGFGIRGEGLGEAERRARIERAGEAAGLGPDIAVLPDGYETLVGERGITLSGGQRQRVALARALAADPQILLLDDTLSSVDAQTEREILTRLRPILRERTSVIVSHRVAAVKEADQILVLDAGKVAERGTHGELLGRGGLYATLYREQLAAEAAGEAT